MTTYIKIFAGLCNRLFQYSYGKYLLTQGKSVKFISADDGNTDILDVMELGEDEKLFYTNSKNTKLFVNLLKARVKYITRNYKIGFYQDPLYSENINFKFKNISLYEKDSITTKLSESNSVSLHIRGGDYLDPSKAGSFIGICTKDYYIKAIKTAQKKIKNPVFFIFTNDRPYAESIINDCLQDKSSSLTEKNFVFADDQKDKNYDDGFDLFLMSKCKANIIANSTFSWWGAVLNKNAHTVICPSHWTNAEPYEHDNLILSDWIKI